MVADSAGVNLLPDEVQREMEFGSKKALSRYSCEFVWRFLLGQFLLDLNN